MTLTHSHTLASHKLQTVGASQQPTLLAAPKSVISRSSDFRYERVCDSMCMCCFFCVNIILTAPLFSSHTRLHLQWCDTFPPWHSHARQFIANIQVISSTSLAPQTTSMRKRWRAPFSKALTPANRQSRSLHCCLPHEKFSDLFSSFPSTFPPPTAAHPTGNWCAVSSYLGWFAARCWREGGREERKERDSGEGEREKERANSKTTQVLNF